MADNANPFAALVQLALEIYRFEQARYLNLGTRMQALPGRTRAMETALLELAPKARAAWRSSGWPAKDVHKTVTSLVESCLSLMAWATLRGDWHQLSDAVLMPLRDVQAMADSYTAGQGEDPAMSAKPTTGRKNKQPKKRGRKCTSDAEERRRNKIIDAWEKFRDSKSGQKTDFCKDQKPKMTVKELNRILAWKRTRRNRSAE